MCVKKQRSGSASGKNREKVVKKIEKAARN